jgi:hypothetical protein
MSGWKLVPAEPTPEMLRAIHWHDYLNPMDTDWAVAYRIMLNAAPEAPSAEPVSAGELARLRDVDRRCGKDNCLGQDVEGVARWVREERLTEHHEVMLQALEALEAAHPYLVDYCKSSFVMAHDDAIDALRAALGERT